MKIYSWGSNSHDQLGQGIQIEQLLIPTPINTSVEAKCITGGGKHTVVLTSEHELHTCGDNDKGQLGNEDFSVITLNKLEPIHCPHKVVKVVCGWDFNLALTDNFEVLGWGSNSFGQLGLPMGSIKHVTSPLKIFHSKAKEIGAGLRHSIIIDSEGLVFASGYGRKGQLGIYINDVLPVKVDKFTQVSGVADCQEVSCGECHTIAKTQSQEIFCWGNNKYGQLGINPQVQLSALKPIKITLPVEKSEKTQLFSGWANNCVLTDGGQLITWGRNDFGQLGEERKESWKPEAVKKLDKIIQVSVGSHHTVALTEAGLIFTWGWNEHGNCGNNTCENIKSPCEIKEVKSVKMIGSGAAHSFLVID